MAVLPALFAQRHDLPGGSCTQRAALESVQATVGDTPITAARVAHAAGGRLLRLQAEEYNLKRKALDDLIDQTLLRKEAERRGIEIVELIRMEVEQKTPLPTDADKQAALAALPPHRRSLPEAELLDGIELGLIQQRQRQRRAKFLEELRNKAGVQVYLEPPRVAVNVEGAPAWGPETAAVTLVQFSDFECPFCASAPPILKRLKETYGDRLRIVYRHFPLDSHKAADTAAEAGACAQEQGKFWEMHDTLFANRGKLGPDHIKKYARNIGLNAEQFDACLDSRKYITRWKYDRDEGIAYGVAGTPAFFVNGRPLYGAQPYEALAALIDEEFSCLFPRP